MPTESNGGEGRSTPSVLDRAAREPLGVDISDYSDEWCAGFLAGQVNALEYVDQVASSHSFSVREVSHWSGDGTGRIQTGWTCACGFEGVEVDGTQQALSYRVHLLEAGAKPDPINDPCEECGGQCRYPGFHYR